MVGGCGHPTRDCKEVRGGMSAAALTCTGLQHPPRGYHGRPHAPANMNAVAGLPSFVTPCQWCWSSLAKGPSRAAARSTDTNACILGNHAPLYHDAALRSMQLVGDLSLRWGNSYPSRVESLRGLWLSLWLLDLLLGLKRPGITDGATYVT